MQLTRRAAFVPFNQFISARTNTVIGSGCGELLCSALRRCENFWEGGARRKNPITRIEMRCRMRVLALLGVATRSCVSGVSFGQDEVSYTGMSGREWRRPLAAP